MNEHQNFILKIYIEAIYAYLNIFDVDLLLCKKIPFIDENNNKNTISILVNLDLTSNEDFYIFNLFLKENENMWDTFLDLYSFYSKDKIKVIEFEELKNKLKDYVEAK